MLKNRFLYNLLVLIIVSGNLIINLNAKDAIAIIVHKSSSLNNLDLAVLEKIYKGKQKKVQACNINPLEYKSGTPIKEKFIKLVFNSSCKDLQSYWLREKLDKGAKQPKVISNSKTMINYISKVKNAMGYLSWDELNENLGNPNIKVLQINNVSPSSETIENGNYPLLIND